MRYNWYMDFEEAIQRHFPKDVALPLLEAMQKEPSHCVLLNPKKVDPEAFAKRFSGVCPHPFLKNAFFYKKEEYDFGKSILHAAGAIYIQDASAMMVPYFLSPKIGETCIDLCAAPGGKTIGVSFLNGGEGAIVSNDISYPRAKELSGNVERLGLGNVYVSSLPPKELSAFYGEIFDNVILDAPCSGSAMFRKSELSKEDWTFAKVESCASLQAELLETAYSLLREGGKLIYSTCSFSYEENEANVLRFLSSHPDMEILPLPLDSRFYRPTELKESVYLLPSLFEGEGQFIALLRKKGNGPSIPLKQIKGEKNRVLQGILDEFGLKDGKIVRLRDSYFYLPSPFVLPPNCLRAGVKIKENENDPIPDYALSHFLPSSSSIDLTLSQAKLYLRGETFPLKEKEGIHAVKFNENNLGFVKIVKGVAKNHYPKGLRHDYPSNIDY